MAIFVTSSLLLPPSPVAVPCRKSYPPLASQSADGKLHHLLCRSLPLTVNEQGSSSAPTTTRLLGHYAHLASKLVLSGRLNEFLSLAEGILTSDAITAAESAGFMARIEAKFFSEGISAVISHGRIVDVLDFLGKADKLGIRPLSLVVGSATKAFELESRRLMQQGRLEEFVRLMEILTGYGLFIKDVSNPGATIKLFVEKRQPELAVRYASLFPQFRVLVCSVIQEYGKKKDKFSATRTYKAFSEKFEDMYVCRSLIDAYGLCGDFLKSRQLFEGLLAKNITPNIFIFNSLMNVNSHDLSYTLNVYSHMQILGVTADMTSYNILLKACHKARRVDLAQKIYKEAKQVALDGAFKLDIITYSTMMKVFADAEMREMAFKIKDEMCIAGMHPNVVTWSILISACANATLIDKAVRIFEEMLLAGCEPNAHCYNSLLYACVESCQYDRAFRFFSTWKEVGFEINRNQGSKHVIPFKPTVATFNILMKACGTDHFRAKALIKEMKMIGLSPNHISWSILIGIYGNSYDMKGALQALRTMRDTGIKVDVIAYTVAIKACVQNGNARVAFSLFEEMKRYQLKPNWVTYKTLLRARSQYGSLCEVQQCLAVYQDMRKAGYSSNDYYLKELLEEWCEGVISSNSPKKNLHSIDKRFNANNSKKLGCLLEKVAIILQKDMDEYQAIDIRGLTQVEARIVVLSVLRMIKENYQQGKVIRDDMTIILGVGDESELSAGNDHEVKHAIVRVLRDELGLRVLAGHKPDESSPAVVKKPALAPGNYRLARRPQDSGFLKVSKESIHEWLRRKEVAKIRFNRSFMFLGRHRSVVK